MIMGKRFRSPTLGFNTHIQGWHLARLLVMLLRFVNSGFIDETEKIDHNCFHGHKAGKL